MQMIWYVGILLLAYVFGSIPFGLIIVRLKTGKDIRTIESGRTGGTNAMRAAGFWAGLFTAILDILKGAAVVWVAKALAPQAYWLHTLAPLAAILGHNYSIFLAEREAGGRLRLRGGAGGAPSVGGALGLWSPSILIILPLGAFVFFTLGYASVTTMSVALFATIIFLLRALSGQSPWAYVAYGVVAEFLLIWALRPNIQKLLAGNERIVSISLHGRLKRKQNNQENTAEAVRKIE